MFSTFRGVVRLLSRHCASGTFASFSGDGPSRPRR